MKRQPECVCVNLRRAARAMTQLYDDALAASGITVTQFSLLAAVERNQPAPIGVLAGDLDLDRTTLARNLGLAARDGLIASAAGSDRRVTETRLTAKGRKALAAARPLWEKVQADTRARLGAGQVDQLRAIAAAATALAKVGSG